MSAWGWAAAVAGSALLLLALYDLLQHEHAVLRNFPLVGHLRYLLEGVGPELRQYIVTDNSQERPFDRDQRRWVYTSAKAQLNTIGFGTGKDLELTPDYVIVEHSTFPLPRPAPGEDRLPGAKILGGARGRARAFRPSSAINISAMSFGALSGPAVEAINRGSALAGCLHNTGESGVTRHHRHGGELVFQIGTGYFGCRDEAGRFSLPRLVDLCSAEPVRAIEIKLSQGAKPGLGGVLPAVKVTSEVATARGVPPGVDCLSPSIHSTFRDADSLLDFVELVATATGLPVGIKSAVGTLGFWEELATLMGTTGRGVDFITVDGGEGGSGDAPLAFSDHVSLPFKLGMSRVYRIFAERRLTDQVTFVGSGRLGFPDTALVAFALGCDLVNVGREAMLAIGCIQAQRCHTGRCPVGVTTQSAWRSRGLDPALKSVRLANYVSTLRLEILQLSRACGVEHPALVGSDQIQILDGHFGARSLSEVFGYAPGWARPSPADQDAIRSLMAGGPAN